MKYVHYYIINNDDGITRKGDFTYMIIMELHIKETKLVRGLVIIHG